MDARRANASRWRPFSVAWLVLALLTLLSLSACKNASKSGKSDDTTDTPFGAAPGSKNITGGGTIPQARPALPAGWREFKHPDGAYTIFVPAAPIRDPMSPGSLKLKQPLQPFEARVSTHGVNPTAKQPLMCKMEVTVFDNAWQSTLEGSMLQNAPKDNINMKVTSYRDVNWSGCRAKEGVTEQTYAKGPKDPPLRYFSVMRFGFAPGRLYMFSIGRENQLPTNAELSAFFDSFVPGGGGVTEGCWAEIL